MPSIQKKGNIFLVKSKFGSFRQDNQYDAIKLSNVLADYEKLSEKRGGLKEDK